MDSVENSSRHLFSESPGLAGSVSLDVDVESPSEFFEVLLLIMTYGMQKWYGKRINIADVSTEHILLLQKYFLSFGVILHVDKNIEPSIYAIDNKEYCQKDNLNDMVFTVVAHKSLYSVYFSFAPGFAPKWV